MQLNEQMYRRGLPLIPISNHVANISIKELYEWSISGPE